MKIRQIITIIFIVTVFVSGYVFGYLRSTKNTEFMLSANSAMLSMATLKNLEENKFDVIKSIHTTGLEASINGIQGAIEMEKSPFRNLRNLYYYHELYDIDEAGMEQVSKNILKKYKIYKENNT